MSDPDLEREFEPRGRAADPGRRCRASPDRRRRPAHPHPAATLSHPGGLSRHAGGKCRGGDGSLKNFSFDLIILDVMMPGENGFDFAARLRADIRRARPRADPDADGAQPRPTTALQGFESGVDDFLGKPFEPRELALRIASILRRAQPQRAATQITHVRFGGFVFDLQRGELKRGDEIVRLTERERDMLRLARRARRRNGFARGLAGPGGAGNERTVDVQVNRLRRKIERDPANPLHLQTVRGAGYRLLLDA